MFINTYINFNGNCEDAFNYYKSVFGGEFLSLSRFKDGPPGGPMSKDEADKVMHVALPIGKTNVLMGSDCPASYGKVNAGSNVNISVHPDSEQEAARIFNALSAGGKVIMPLQKMFWNAYFGMCADKFGIQWMVNYDYNQKH